MGETRVSRSIAAPVHAVFEVVAHIDRFREAIPHIVDVAYLSDETRGVGTRFRETGLMGKRRATTDLECTEYEPPNRVRMVSDAGGAVWDTVLTVTEEDEGCRLEMVMDARPHSLFAKITVPLFGRMVTKAVEADMDAVKAHCEAAAD